MSHSRDSVELRSEGEERGVYVDGQDGSFPKKGKRKGDNLFEGLVYNKGWQRLKGLRYDQLGQEVVISEEVAPDDNLIDSDQGGNHIGQVIFPQKVE